MTTRKRRGSYYYRFWHRGRLYEKGGFTSKRRALEAEWERRREVGANERGRAPRPISFSEALDRFVAEVVVPREPKKEWGRYYRLKEFFANKPLNEITPSDIEQFRAWRRAHSNGKIPSGATLNRDLAHLSALFSWAQRNRLIPAGTNPASARHVKRATEDWRPWMILTPEQEDRLYSLLPPLERAQVVLLKNLGVRKGVVLGLKWEDIDWTHRLARYTSKGKSGVIPLNQDAIEVLKGLGPMHSGLVFEDASASKLRYWWDKARKALNLPHLRLHDLRVTFARQLAERGASLKTIQDLLGHSTPIMTNRYIPTDLQERRRAVKLLERSRRDVHGDGRES